jgi:NAD(P)-dependent dehydrogenase (short-subunit alcohol dehydrogenase family)
MGLHDGTVAVITGGAQGLGRAVAERLVAEGCARVVISGRDAAKGARAAAEIGAQFVAAEIGDVAQVRGLIAAAEARFGRVTALVNAAAVTDRASVLDCTPEEWDRQFAVNARGPFFAIQAVAQAAVAAGQGASIVNILSMSAHCGQSFLAPYSASKAALMNVTKNAANALRKSRIRVNGINAGWMDTPGENAIQRKWHGAGDDWLAKAEAGQPFGSLVKPDHVAGLVSYLLSDASGVVTGSIVDFDQNVAGSFPE